MIIYCSQIHADVENISSCSSPAADCVNSSDNQESPSPHEDLKHPPTVSSLKSSVVEGYESPITRPVHLLQSSGSTASSDAKSSSKDSPVVIDKRDTPVCVKILRSKRKKHHSSTVFTSFFPPAQLGSPRPRSRSTGTINYCHKLEIGCFENSYFRFQSLVNSRPLRKVRLRCISGNFCFGLLTHSVLIAFGLNL